MTATVDPAMASTLIMTLLLGVGLFFFVRAAAKDRTETRCFRQAAVLEELAGRIRQYLAERSYRLQQADPDTGVAEFAGQARPSTFLSVFLTALAACGLSCLVLVIEAVWPTRYAWILVASAPLAGLYYRRKSARPERVRLQLQALDNGQVQLWIAAHRDELNTLQETLHLEEATV